MQRSGSSYWAAALLVGWVSATTPAEETASAKQIAQWAAQLGDNSFAVRESASEQLVQAGRPAIEAVAAAAMNAERLEVTVRALRILNELALSPDEATARSAKAALGELAGSKRPAVAARARSALRTYQLNVATVLQRCGARMQSSDGRIVSVNFDEAKDFVKHLHLLHELPDVEHLSFSTPLMDDDALAELRGLPRLRDLNLYRSRIGDDGLKHMATFPSLERIPMGETRVTDRGLVHLKDLTQLEYVGLRGNQVTDDGLVHLKNLTNLTGLYLGETKVTDAGLAHLKPLTKLNLLLLGQADISDAGLEHLKGLTELRSIDLSETKVTEAGLASLKRAIPEVQIRTKTP
jgi:hypothetical protein